MASKLISIILKLEDKFSKPLGTASAAAAKFDESAGRWRDESGRFVAATDKAESALSRLGGQMTSVGNAMTVGLTLPLVAAGGAAIKAAMDFETAFTGVRKTVDLTDAQFDELNANLRDLATNTDFATSALPNAHTELARIAEMAGQLGIEGVDNITSFTETIAMLGVTTNLTVEEAAQNLARFANVTGLPIERIGELGDVVVTLGNNFATTESEIVNFGSRLGGLSQVGFSPQDILAYGAALSSLGISAELGGSNFTRFAQVIAVSAAQGGEALNSIARVAGVTSQEFQNLMNTNPSEAIFALLEGFGELNLTEQVALLESLGLSGTEMNRVILALSGNTEMLADAQTKANEAMAGNNALMDEAAQFADTTQGQMQRLMNNLNDLAITVGEELLPAFNELVLKGIEIVQWLGDLDPALISLAVQLAGIVAIAGPILSIVGTLVSLFAQLQGLIVFITPLMGGLGVVLAFIASPVGIAIVAIGALLVALWAFRDQLAGFSIWLSENVVGAFTWIAEGVTEIITNIINAWLTSWPILVNHMTQGFNNLVNGVKSALTFLVRLFTDTEAAFLELFSAIGIQAASLEELMFRIGVNLIKALLSGATTLGQSVINWFGDLADKIVDQVKRAFGIASPSKVFAGIGGDLVAGFDVGTKGFDASIAALNDTMAFGVQTMQGTAGASGLSGLSGLSGVSSSTTTNNNGQTIIVERVEVQATSRQLMDDIKRDLGREASRFGDPRRRR